MVAQGLWQCKIVIFLCVQISEFVKGLELPCKGSVLNGLPRLVLDLLTDYESYNTPHFVLIV